ncbi:tape measure protein [Pseudoalteromonas luteoviolacea]|uniref:tape measure protein n=1 Tax=Pseudoalteromonas luteoviolacea TaxID=43657 RepID=UPI000A661EB3|nr:tape measure protein [Pseudoalteromonas luteoviolacea]
MKNQLNLALRIRYDGKAVTTGTAKNLQDLNRLPGAIQSQVGANQRLSESQSKVAKSQTAVSKAVSTGTNQNLQDLNRLPGAIQNQVKANQRLGASQAKVMQQQTAMSKAVTSGTNKTINDLNRLSDAIKNQIAANQRLGESQAKVLQQQAAMSKMAASSAHQHIHTLNRVPQTIQNQVAANQRLGTSQTKVMQQQSAMGKQLGVLQSGYEQLGITLAGVASIGTAAMFIRDTGAAQQLDTRLQGLTDSTREYKQVQSYLFEAANRLNTYYTTLSDSYSKILNLQQAGIVTQTQGKAILEGMANAAAKTGASNIQLEQSLFGMTQGMTAGVLRAEELNQVTEPLPGLLQKLDKAAGVAAGGFRQLVNDGRITSQMFKRYLIKALNEYAGAAEATEGKINASFAEMSNEYQRLIREYEKPVNFAVTGVADAVTAGMRELRENQELVEGLTTSATTLAIVLGGKLAGGAAKATAAFTATTMAKHKALQADLQLAASNQRLAAEEHRRAIQEQAAAQRQLAMASNTALRTKAIHQLALANQRATLAQTNLNAATATYTVVSKRAALSSRVLGGAMGMLGGPVGLAVTAGLAIAYFATQGDKASTSSKRLETHLYDLGDAFDSVNNVSAKAQIASASKQTINYTNNIQNAYKRIKQLRQQMNNAGSDRAKFTYQNQIAGIERYINEQAKLRSESMKTAAQAANLQQNLKALDWKQIAENSKQATNALPQNIQQLQLSLLDEEARLKASYEKRKDMVIQARENDLGNKAKYDAILKQLDAKLHADQQALADKHEAEKTRIQNQAVEKRKNDLRAELEDRIAQIKGYANREALASYNNQLAVEEAKQQARIDAKRRSMLGLAANDEVGEIKHNADNQIRDLERQQELNAARGFHSQREADEYAHQERLMQARTRNTGAMQQHLTQFANWETKNAREKTSAVVGLGAAGFKAMAGQSKTAFKLYKAFSITQAMIKTYESATGAYAALAPIPVVGPALGAAAAAAAVAMGLQQVRMIKAQQPAGIAHGGLDYVPNESTYVLQRGERVLSPKQNVEISHMARHYNAGNRQSAGQNVVFNITNQITVEGAANAEQGNVIGANLTRQIEAVFVESVNSRGAVFRAIRSVV